MDPQKLSQLDPKLRDVYQRVMETNAPSQSAPAQTQTPVQTAASPLLNIELQPDPQPAVNPQSQSVPIPQSTIPTQPIPTTPPPTPTPTSNFTVPAPQSDTLIMKKKSGPIKRILFIFIIVALIFVVIYALFLTKVFTPKL